MVNIDRHGDTQLEYKPCLPSQCDSTGYTTTARKTPRPWLRDHSVNYNHGNDNVHITSINTCNKTTSQDKHMLYNNDHLTSGETRTYSYVTDLNVTYPESFLDEHNILEALPYFELPSKSGSTRHKQQEYIQNITHRTFSPRRGGYIPGTNRLKVVVFCIIISMLVLCKGCVCTCSDNLVSRARSEYLTFVNETNMAAISGQCLTMTGSAIDSICEARTDTRISLSRNTYTPFCELPVYSLLSSDEINTVQNCARDNGCARVLNHVRALDEELSDMFCQFEDVVERIDCKDMFPEEGNCSLCKTAYKQWLCSVYNVHFIEGVPIKPCIEICDQVSESCPFFRPYGETLIGEPGFLCKALISPTEAAGSVYGPDGCCKKPCHLFPTGYCPDLDISSNCTYRSNSALSLSCRGHTLLLYMITAVIILCSYTSRTFPCDRNIGLT